MKLHNLRYDSYSTGPYGKHLKDGVTIQFIDMDTGAIYFVIWNVVLTRQRATKNHPKGSRYSGKQFSVSKKRKFFKFWHFTCGLPIPTRGLTTFHDCMGKLKDIQFEAEVKGGGQLYKDTVQPFSAHIYPIGSRQQPDKTPIKVPDKHVVEPETETDFEDIPTTCPDNYVISKQVSEYTSNPISPIDETKRVQNQTTDEWLAEYEEQWAKECNALF
jgi:hypothetical protein